MTHARLLIVSFSNISADARVLKQVELFADSYDVTTCGYGPTPDRRVRHVQLEDSEGIRRWRRIDLILRRFARVYWSQPAVRRAMLDLKVVGRFDVILANDIDTLGLSLALEPRFGVHADIHEYAPRQNEEILVWRWFIAPYVHWMCRQFLARVTSMTTVGAGIASEYQRVYGVEASVVTNASPYATCEPQSVDLPLRLVHSGASIRNRRLEVMIDAALATTNDVTLDLYLMPNDPAYIAELSQRIAGSERVRFRDPVPYDQLISRLNEYDLGIHVIAPTNFNNEWALPNKFFDYVQARLGIVIGPTVEMEQLLKQFEIGVVTRDFSASALRDVLDAADPATVFGWKVNADGAARSLSSESQVDTWGDAIGAIVNRRSP